MTERLFRLVALIFTLYAAPAWGQAAYWMTIADPQMDQRCDYLGEVAGVYSPGDPEYEACSSANEARVARAFAIAKTLRDRLPNFFVWILGDHTQSRTDREKTIMRDLIEPYPEVTFRFAAGNHDGSTSTCGSLAGFWSNAYAQTDTDCDAFEYGTNGSNDDCTRPQYEHWSVNGYHFITLDSTLWGGGIGPHCDHPTTGAFTAEAQAQKTFLTASVTTALADPNLVHIITASHHEVFRTDAAATSIGSSAFFVFHNRSFCTTAETPANTQCFVDGDCTGADTCVADADRQYRQHWLNESDRVFVDQSSCKMIWHLSGHGHQDFVWRPTEGSCTYEFHETMALANSGAPNPGSIASLQTTNRHSVNFFTGLPDGTIRKQRIIVEPRSEALQNGEELFLGTVFGR